MNGSIPMLVRIRVPRGLRVRVRPNRIDRVRAISFFIVKPYLPLTMTILVHTLLPSMRITKDEPDHFPGLLARRKKKPIKRTRRATQIQLLLTPDDLRVLDEVAKASRVDRLKVVRYMIRKFGPELRKTPPWELKA